MPIQIDLAFVPSAPWSESFRGLGVSLHQAGGVVIASLHGPDPSLLHRQAEECAKFLAIARNAFAGDPAALAWWEANRLKGPPQWGDGPKWPLPEQFGRCETIPGRNKEAK